MYPAYRGRGHQPQPPEHNKSTAIVQSIVVSPSADRGNSAASGIRTSTGQDKSERPGSSVRDSPPLAPRDRFSPVAADGDPPKWATRANYYKGRVVSHRNAEPVGFPRG